MSTVRPGTVAVARLCVGTALALAPIRPVAAATATIAPYTSQTAYDWASPSTWSDGVVPTNAADSAVLFRDDCSGVRLVMRFNRPFRADAVLSGPEHGYYMLKGATDQRVGFRDFSGFNDSIWPLGFGYAGSWKDGVACSGVDFLGTAAAPSVLRRVFLASCPHFGVPEPGGAGRIDRLMNPGAFAKDGPGTLTVAGPVGLNAAVFLKEGPLAFAASEEPACDAPAAGAFFHVDASLASSLLTLNENGRTYVTNWSDATGNGRYAKSDVYVNGAFSLGRPYLADYTVNGRPLVDFGDYFINGSSVQSEERPASWMTWDRSATGVREMFLAVAFDGGQPAPIGHNTDMTLKLHSGDGNVVDSYVACTGDVRVDGEPAVGRGGRRMFPSRLRIVSVAVGAPGASAGWFGRSGSFSIIGGFRLGEALVYTNALTEAERRQTIAYLKKRWFPAETHRAEAAEWDFGDLVVGADAGTVSVAAGDVARLRRVRVADGATLVKDGSGTLAVDRIVPADAAVRVDGGAIRFADTAGPAPDLSAMPDEPAFHFDASDRASFDFVDGSETAVTNWHDVRAGSTVVASKLGYDPPLLTAGGSPTGLPVVEFPAESVTGGTKNPRMVFQDTECHEGFIVWKATTDKGTYAPTHFSCYGKGHLGFRKTASLLSLSVLSSYPCVAGAVWAVDGQVIDPFDASFSEVGGNDGWVLIRFTSTTPFLVNAMAAHDRSYGGGCAVAELVGYDRPLTDRERRGAEAYLMKKWLGKEHPDNIVWSGGLSVNAGTDAVIDAACDLSPSSFSSAATGLVKKGAGTVTLGSTAGTFARLTVEGGALALPAAAVSALTSLSVAVEEAGSSAKVTAAGDLTLPPSCAVSVSVPSDAVAESLSGTAVALIAADRLLETERLAGWTLETSGCGKTFCRLGIRGNAVVIRFGAKGTSIILR